MDPESHEWVIGVSDAAALVSQVMSHYLVTSADAVGSRPVAAVGPPALHAAAEAETLARVGRYVEIASVRRQGQPIVSVAAGSSGAADVVVVTDDTPLLVESVLATLETHGLTAQRVDHPILEVVRDDDGRLTAVGGGRGALSESWISISALSSHGDVDGPALRSDLVRVVGVVGDINTDTAAMRGALLTCAAEYTTSPVQGDHGITAIDRYEYSQLLQWFAGTHFIPLGYVHIDAGVAVGGLGVARGRSIDLDVDASSPGPLVPQVSRVHYVTGIQRSDFPTLVRVPAVDESGVRVGEHRFIGVFTSSGLHQTVLDIPVLRTKVHDVLAQAGAEEDSYAGSEMIELLQNYPLVEMFQDSTIELGRRVTQMLDAEATRSVRVLLRANPEGQAASALIYLPRDNYNTDNRLALQREVARMLSGSDLEYSARVSELPLAQLQVMVRVDSATARSWGPVGIGSPLHSAMQVELTRAIRSWDDRVRELIVAAAAQPDSEIRGAITSESASRLIAALPAEYKDQRAPHDAVGDLARVAALEPGSVAVTLRPVTPTGQVPATTALGQVWDFTLYLCAESATLTDVLPVLHSLGLDVIDEHPYLLTRPDGQSCHVYEFAVTLAAGMTVDETAPDLSERFTAAFTQIWRQRAEVDAYNELIIRCGLRWREAAMLRAYGHYLKQCGFPYSTTHIASTLGHYAEVTRGVVALFEASFDPENADPGRREAVLHALEADLGAVLSLDADRVVSAFAAVVSATDRTNFYVRGADSVTDGPREDHAYRPVLSFKLRTGDIPQAPDPRPAHEIFVYSPRVEGVHLRFGAVARGGLRWSDRREDYRTEILGLVKAQAVKNAVIVPLGAKGGFVLSKPPAPTGDTNADRDALRAEGIECYRMFISGLLDVTDNIDPTSGQVIPAGSVVRRDGDDPYLVVAADKGTASFSDIANGVANAHGFWLGDAFASGGSAGYDHKAMGITARGAWEAVKRHFREMRIDTQTDDFTVVGIGDMSGDVFGNGMLLSQHIRLVAAFDHRHIFIDPSPDPVTSHAERTRLFDMPRSSWADYDPDLISQGGGVWPRDQKSIPITSAAAHALGLDSTVIAMTPPELIRAILLAPVDLLWNGGIGTYVRASTESDAEVGDKANDAIRVTGDALRVKVIGEGGNLGVTERGRIEFDLAGGRVNTDAMDNSAGVDCSDHEVNIKILLDAAVSAGELGAADRTPLLESMTDEVAGLVLADNVSQNAELGFSRAYAAARVDVHERLLRALGARGVNLRLEALPDAAELRKRYVADGHRGLTSPELATVMAHVKLAAKDDILASDLPDNDVFDDRLAGYFPVPLRTRFAAGIHAHRLRRQIVATVVVNDLVDHAGVTHIFRLGEATGASTQEAARAYVVAEEVFGLTDLLNEIQLGGRGAGGQAPLEVEAVDQMWSYARRLIFRASRWFLAFRPQPLAMAAEITRYRERVGELTALLDSWFGAGSGADVDARVEHYRSLGAPPDLAHAVALSLHRFCLLDIIDAAEIADRDPVEVGELYFGVMEHFGLEELLTAVSRLEYGDRWHSLARLALRDDIHGALRALTLKILENSEPEESARDKISEWEDANSSRLSRVRAMLAEIEQLPDVDLATLSVAARQLRSVIR